MFLWQIVAIYIVANFKIVPGEIILKTTKIECDSSPKFMYNHSCFLKPINRYKTLIFMEGEIRNSLNNMLVNVSVYMRNDKNIYRPFLMKYKTNLCAAFNNAGTGFYTKTLMKVFAKYSNMNHSCPFTGTLLVQELVLDFANIPVVISSNAAYKFLIEFYEGKHVEYLGMAAFFFDAIETNRNRIKFPKFK